MNPGHRTLHLALCALLSQAALAADTAAERDPSDMTVEERTAIMQRMGDYNSCVYKESMARVDQLPDIRQAADEGMAACQASLDKMGETIAGFNFSEAFAEQFRHLAQSRAAKMVIPELSLRKGSQ